MTKFVFKAPHAFIMIPKLASSTVSAALQHHLWWGETSSRVLLDDPVWIKDLYPHLTTPAAPWSFCTLVRHPLERWPSGMAQHYVGALTEKDVSEENRPHVEALTDEQRLSEYLQDPHHDPHTERQSAHWGDMSGVKMFKLEHIDKLWDWLGVEPPADGHIRKAAGHQARVSKRITEIIGNKPKYRERLLHYYHRDYAAWQKAE